VIEAGNFLAARFGIRARLPDAEGRMCSFDEVLAQALEMARPHAAELGCVAELGRLEGLVAIGGGAGRQRTLHERVGIDGLAQELMALTVPAS
jgi:gamma-glutamyl:cysteine ligase YbdK (ATP-grasp superfamily)